MNEFLQKKKYHELIFFLRRYHELIKIHLRC